MKSYALELGEAKLSIQVAGTGDALIFLHAGIADKRMWEPQFKALSQSHKVIAYDRRGFGETESPNETFSHVADLEAILTHEKINQATLIGCSQGGRIALDFALKHPTRVHKLVLIAPAISGQPQVKDYPKSILTIFKKLDEAEEANDLTAVNATEAHLWLDGPLSKEGRVKGQLRDLFLDMNAIALAMPELSLEKEAPSAYNKLNSIDIPSLVMWGDLDFPHLIERCEYLTAELKNASSKALSNTAHLPNLEKAKEVTKHISNFLNS